jgi:hypothetical protein
VVRHSLPRLRATVIPTFNQIRMLTGGFVGEVNKSEWVSTCTNGSQILFFAESLQDDPDLDRWRGLEANGFLFEEANELGLPTFNKAIERRGTWRIPHEPGTPEPPPPPRLIICTFNPCETWPRSKFYEPWKAGTLEEGYLFIPATQKDNKYITDTQRKDWRQLPPREYARFVEGDWTNAPNPKQLIHYEWLRNAANVEHVDVPPYAREAVDCAHEGDDSTVFAWASGNMLADIDVYQKIDNVAIANIAQDHMGKRKVRPEQFRIDAIGFGAGARDILRSRGYDVWPFVAGGKMVPRRLDMKMPAGKWAPESVLSFADLRSQAWWELADKLRLGQIRIPLELQIKYPTLIEDLLAIEYHDVGDRMIGVDDKKTLRKRLHRSPDVGDAVMMLFFDRPKSQARVFTPADYAGSYVKW